MHTITVLVAGIIWIIAATIWTTHSRWLTTKRAGPIETATWTMFTTKRIVSIHTASITTIATIITTTMWAPKTTPIITLQQSTTVALARFNALGLRPLRVNKDLLSKKESQGDADVKKIAKDRIKTFRIMWEYMLLISSSPLMISSFPLASFGLYYIGLWTSGSWKCHQLLHILETTSLGRMENDVSIYSNLQFLSRGWYV